MAAAAEDRRAEAPSSGRENALGDAEGGRLVMYKTKLVQFLGRSTPIILQNDNGPCPLLAICNVLLLRNVIELSHDVPEVSQDQLLVLVAERLLDSNSNVKSKDVGYVSNQQQNISDAIDLLPRLATGIDVNVHFQKINDFEFTRECAIFDLLDIGLYHGWIVDPEDKDTAKAIGSKSYNTLVGELVALETQILDDRSNSIEEDTVDFAAATAAILGIPSPSLSRGQSFDDHLPVSPAERVGRKGDLEEEAELIKVLTISKSEFSMEAASSDKALPPLEGNNSSSNIEEDTVPESSDTQAILESSVPKVIDNCGIAAHPNLLLSQDRGSLSVFSTDTISLGVCLENNSHVQKSSCADVPDHSSSTTVPEPSDTLTILESSVAKVNDNCGIAAHPNLLSSQDRNSLVTFSTDTTSIGSCLENISGVQKSSCADVSDHSKSTQFKNIQISSKSVGDVIPSSEGDMPAALNNFNISNAVKNKVSLREEVSLGTDAFTKSSIDQSVDQNNNNSSVVSTTSPSNEDTGDFGKRDSANPCKDVCSDLGIEEPIYEGEDCILDSGHSPYQNQEPVYEGEVVLASQIDQMEMGVTRIHSGKLSHGRKHIELATISLEEGQLIHTFLENNASQLTVYGLFCLQEGLNERELCVFFRNNHFSTMFKFKGELFLLATDQGYINQTDLVWEKLNEVKGDTVFMTGNFKEFKMDNLNDAWNPHDAMTDTAEYLAALKGSSSEGSSLSSDLQLAIALQEQEFGRQPICPEPQNTPQAPIPRSGLITGPQGPRRQAPPLKQEAKSKDKCVVM